MFREKNSFQSNCNTTLKRARTVGAKECYKIWVLTYQQGQGMKGFDVPCTSNCRNLDILWTWIWSSVAVAAHVIFRNITDNHW